MKVKMYSDLKRLRDIQDVDINYSDIPATDKEFWKGAEVVFPAHKKLLSIRLDEDVGAWFKPRARAIRAVSTRACTEAHSELSAVVHTPARPRREAAKSLLTFPGLGMAAIHRGIRSTRSYQPRG